VPERRGVIVLSEGRSGTNWLGSLARNAGLGNSSEWLDRPLLGRSPAPDRGREFFEAALDAATAGAGFYVKIFPRQLVSCINRFGEDFVRYCTAHYPTSLILVERRDRLRQAISFSRGLQSQQWTSRRASQGKAAYNFDQICECYFLIGRSYEFWRGYLALLGFEAMLFIYEDLLDDPTPFVSHVASSMGAEAPAQLESELRVQRDEITEEWLERFRSDLARRDIVLNAGLDRRFRRSPSNLNRFLRGKEMKVH